MGQLATIAYLSTIFISIFFIAFIIWRIVWFRQFGVEIPIDKNFNVQELNQRKLFYKTKTFDVFTNFFTKIVKTLDMDYWITHTGTDGYLYLLFQRRFLKLLLIFAVISMCVAIPINATSIVIGDQKYADWFEQTTLNNKELSYFKGWIHVILILVFTLLTIRAVQKTRRDARIAYQFYHKSMSKNKDHEWLKARTVHIKGIPPEDRSGNNLKNELERVIAASGGKVLAVLLVPDFVNQLNYEGKIQDMKDLAMLINAQDSRHPVHFNCCVPNRLRDPYLFQIREDKLERKLLEETMKPFKPSGHAFVCFDSIKSVNMVLQHYRIGPVQYLKLLFFQIKDKIRSCFYTQQRDRVQSTFIKFEDIDAQVQAQGVKDQVLLINLASEPIDILWKNLGGSRRGVFIFRRLFLHALTLIIILFISTPTAMLSTLKQVDVFGVFDFSWTSNLPFGQFVKAHFPPLVIICINQVLLFLIDIASYVERHESHSLYQSSIYLKAVVYLNLNMLVIPALTLTSSESLITIFFKKQFNITQILGDFYIANSGIFFVSILIQQACLSSGFYLMNLPDIFFSYFSPWLALEKRKIFNDSAPWRRKENFCFQYGYFYAQMMAVFAIALIFSSTVPLVTVAAVLFMGLKHIVDCLQLLTYFRKEIDSSGRLISQVTNTALLFTILYQLCMMAFFVMKKRQEEAVVICFIFVISILFAVISYEDVYDLSKVDEESNSDKIFNEEAFVKWKSEYEHPLVIGNVARKARSLGVEVKTVNDWTQFIEDKDVQGILFPPSQRYRKSGFFQMSEEYKIDAENKK